MVNHVPRHERVDAQLWDEGLRRWRPLLPFLSLDMPYMTDWDISLATLKLAGDHPQSAAFNRVRAGVPLPVRFTINGVVWDGQITTATLANESGATPVWECKIESDTKHGHRMMARDTTVSAADLTSTRLRGFLGEVTHQMVASGAQRTGLPVYVLIEGEGDAVDVEARTEDHLHDVLQEATVGSRMHLDVRRLLPEDPLPGEGTLYHYAGVMERQWEQAELDGGVWPHAGTDPRIVGASMPLPHLLLPARSWRGDGTVDEDGRVVEERAGVCWVPFETEVTTPADYFNRPDPAGVRVASVEEMRERQDEHPGWVSHLTRWESWTPEHPDSGLLPAAVEEGLVVRPDRTVFTTVEGVAEYVGEGEMWAWRDGPTWVVANAADYQVERLRRAPRGSAQRQTPGLLVHLHPERDRRGVVFSSTPGGGLEAWSVSHTAPDGAMVIAGAQIDERVLAAAREGTLPPSMLGSMTPQEAQDVLPSGSTVPGVVDRVDVDAQPLATVDGTEVSYQSAGGRVDLARAGVMFYREKYLSLSSSGGTAPLHELTRSWAEAQGTSTMSLTPGSSSSVVFGDDVVRPDGTIIPGWRPGDRVSFVDQWTRISEVVAGYRVRAEQGRVVSAVPVLGRRETGVLAGLADALHDAKRDAVKAGLAPSRRLPEQELIAAAAKQAVEAMLVEQAEREAALEAEREAREEARDEQIELVEMTQQEQFILHDNQLKWLAWTKHVFDYRFSTESGAGESAKRGNSLETDLVDVRLNTQGGRGYMLIVRPGWRGTFQLSWTEQGGTSDSNSRTGWVSGEKTVATSSVHETDKVIRYCSIQVWPEHSAAPREWVVRVTSRTNGDASFIAPDTSLGALTISGAPTQGDGGAVILSVDAVASGDVLEAGTLRASGTTLTAGKAIKPVADEAAGLLVFTEVKPDLTWEAGAPLTGRQYLPVSSQTVPRSTWTTLARWTCPDWTSPRAGWIRLTVQWAKYNAWALANYYTRITINGQQVAQLHRGTTGGMDLSFVLTVPSHTLRAGDVIVFQTYATPGIASERRISSGMAEVRWS